MSLRESPELTAAQLAAHRANAQHSTGPRTEEGKSRSRLNALRHGRWATGLAWSEESLRALGEDATEFERLREDLLLAEGPSHDPLWELQIEDLARLYWRRRRLERAWEAPAKAALGETGESSLAAVTPQGALLLKQLDSVDRAIDRKTRLLLRLREAEERQERRLDRIGTRQRDPVFGCDEPLDKAECLGTEDEEALDKELARAEAELRALEEETARREAEERPAGVLNESAGKNLESAERSRNVDENKGPGLKTVTSDEPKGRGKGTGDKLQGTGKTVTSGK